MQGSKFGMKHSGADIEAMAAIARAAKARSLEQFQDAVNGFSSYLRSDDLISHHLDVLYDNMLEANLLKIIYPYSCVEIAHVAKLINLPLATVERKLSQMILDRRFSGILDQGKGHLLIYEGTEEDLSFSKGSEIVANMGLVVESLHVRAKNLQTAGKGGSIPSEAKKDDKEKEKEKGKEKDKEAAHK
jgi:26S proteasome regulatory subunit N6